MSQIMTVQGPIDPAELGVTSMHEHLLTDIREFISMAPQSILDELEPFMDEPITLENVDLMRRLEATNYNMILDDPAVMTAEVNDFKESGGSAIVDVSPIGQRTNIETVHDISAETGVHVITSTGIFYADILPGEVPRGEDLRDLMLNEIKDGIDGTSVKAGHVKIGVLDLTEETVGDLRAIAHVVNETGVSVTVHPGFNIGNDGRIIAKIFAGEGMDLSRLIMAHCELFIGETNFHRLILEPENWGLDLDYCRELLDQGVTVSFDSFGSSAVGFQGVAWPPDWKRLAAVVSLIREGYGGQTVLATDAGLKTQHRRYGGHGYKHLTEFVLPTLKEVGVSEYAIRQMTVENPARLLAF